MQAFVLVVGACLSPRKGAATADTALLPAEKSLDIREVPI